MKRGFVLVLLSFCFFHLSFAQALIDPELLQLMNSRSSEKFSVNIILKESIDANSLNVRQSFSSRDAKREYMIEETKALAEKKQADVLKTLQANERGNSVTDIRCHWIVNMINCKADANAIYKIAEHPDVEAVIYNKLQYMLFNEKPEKVSASTRATALEHVTQVKADQVWNLGYTGKGVVVAVLDTGCNIEHKDLADHLWTADNGVDHGWNTMNNTDKITDKQGHGTHCAGIVCGDGTSYHQTGIAPDAQLMVVKVLGDDGTGDVSGVTGGIEYAIDNGADVLSMSLGVSMVDESGNLVASEEIFDYTATLERKALENALAYGVVAAVAAGNDGEWINGNAKVPRNVNVPGNCPPPWIHPDQQANAGGLSATISVGAVNYSDQLTSFSSQGPVTWNTSTTNYYEYSDYTYNSNTIGLIRPDVVAPGYNITSAYNGDNSNYIGMSGTSMATPCVAGIIALLLDKNPNLTPAEICQVLETTGVELSATKSNQYGSGRVDALAAINSIEAEEEEEGGDDGNTTTGPEIGKQYRIIAVNNSNNYGYNLYLHIFNNSTHESGSYGGVGIRSYAEDNSQIFTLEDAGGGEVYLRSASGYYIRCWQWNVDGNITSPVNEGCALQMVDQGNGTFYLREPNYTNGKANNYFKVQYVNYDNYVFCDAPVGDAELWTFELVPDQPDQPVVTAPEAPTNLTATAQGPETISLSWDAVDGATSYDVYREGNLAATDVTGTTYTDTYLTPMTQYCYQVTAKNSAGTSGKSDEACATTAEGQQQNGDFLLTAEAISDTEIKLTWEAVDGAVGYYIIKDGIKDTGNSVTDGTTTYTDTKLTSGTTYCYKVEAMKNYYTTLGTSNPDCATPGQASLPDLNQATVTLDATAISSTEVQLVVSVPSGYYIQRYVIYDGGVDGGTNLGLQTTTGTPQTDTHTLTGVTPDEHCYQVEANIGVVGGNANEYVTKKSNEDCVVLDGDGGDDGGGDDGGGDGITLTTPVLTVDVISDTEFQLTWTESVLQNNTGNGDPIQATSYSIYVDGGARASTPTLYYILQDWAPGTRHCFQVRAVYDNGTKADYADDIYSEFSNEVCDKIPVKGALNLTTEKDAYELNEPIIFTWDALEEDNLAGYKLYKKENGAWVLIATMNPDETSYGYQGESVPDVYEYSLTSYYTTGDESANEEELVTLSIGATGDIKGKVVQNDTNLPLENATVMIEFANNDGSVVSYTFKTDANGEFSAEDIRCGTYGMIVSCMDHYDKSVDGNIINKDALTDVGTIYLDKYEDWNCDVTATLQNNGEGFADDNVYVTWTNTSYTNYNIYRKNVGTGEIELISHYTTDKTFTDNEWASLNDGTYQYGVSAFTGKTREVMFEEFADTLPEGWMIRVPNDGRSNWNMSNYLTNNSPMYAGYEDPYASYYYNADQYWATAQGLTGEYYLILPKLALKDAVLSFYYATPQLFKGDQALDLCWATSPAGPWTSVWSDISENYFEWGLKELDLSNLPEKYVYLAFMATNKEQGLQYGYGLHYRACLDAVKLISRNETVIKWSNEVIKNTSVIFDNNSDTGDHNWHTAANWTSKQVPQAGANVKIIADAVIHSGNDVEVYNTEISETGSLTIDEGSSYKATGVMNIYGNDPAKFVINDGAQVYQNNEGVQATFNMNIVNPGSWNSDHKAGWQIIASPFTDADILQYVNPTDGGDYDLYKYDGSVDTLEWRNYKLHHDELFCNFENGAEGWTGESGWEHAPLRLGYGNVYGCMQIVLKNQAASDNLMSPRKLNIYPESRLRFYVKIHSNQGDDFYMENYSGINVVYSKQDVPTTFETIHAVTYFTTNWTMVEVDLGSIASTTDDVDAEEAWIAIQCDMQGSNADAILVDDIEFANVYTFNNTEQFNAQPFEKSFVQGRGYMASYESATTVSMVGTLYNENAFTYSGLSYSGSDDMENRWANFFLLGNPFPYDVQWSEFNYSGIVPGFAVVNSTSGAYQYDVDVNNTIKSGDGFMIMTNAANPSLSVNATRGASNRNADYVNVVTNGADGSDNLIISLAGKENGGFFKLDNFNKEIANVFVTNYDDMYGIAYYDEDVEEVDFCFNASNLGYYTISMIPNGDFTSLTLYDRVENVETDMIENKEYKFFALSNDDANENRFVLKYTKKNIESDGSFAYQSGDDLIVNAEGLIQIIDVMGRIVYSGEAQGVNNRINVSGMENATYVIRNINNNGVRTQKIVIL